MTKTEPPIQDLIDRLEYAAHDLAKSAHWRMGIDEAIVIIKTYMGDASTRKDEDSVGNEVPTASTSPDLQRHEIRVTEPEKLPFTMNVQGKVLAKCPECNKDHTMEMVRTEPKPVSVSLDKAAFTLEGKLPWLQVQDIRGVAREFAKEVLDAVGVFYVD